MTLTILTKQKKNNKQKIKEANDNLNNDARTPSNYMRTLKIEGVCAYINICVGLVEKFFFCFCFVSVVP